MAIFKTENEIKKKIDTDIGNQKRNRKKQIPISETEIEIRKKCFRFQALIIIKMYRVA